MYAAAESLGQLVQVAEIANYGHGSDTRISTALDIQQIPKSGFVKLLLTGLRRDNTRTPLAISANQTRCADSRPRNNYKRHGKKRTKKITTQLDWQAVISNELISTCIYPDCCGM